jgi:hypothetical protein
MSGAAEAVAEGTGDDEEAKLMDRCCPRLETNHLHS